MSAEVEDLNSDGVPELVIRAASAGSGSYGSVKAWTVGTQGSRLQPIVLPELRADQTKGYMGHDEFAVVETTLVRRFPIYRPGDSNAKPTGGTRQIQYTMAPAEAGLIFRVDKTLEYRGWLRSRTGPSRLP